MLTHRVATVVALTTAARAHELAANDLDFSLMKEDAREFSIPVQVQISRPFLQEFPWVTRALKVYVQRTAKLRKARQLLASFIAPEGAVSKFRCSIQDTRQDVPSHPLQQQLDCLWI